MHLISKKIALLEKFIEFGLPGVEISFLISLILQGIIRNLNLM
jgi:hypothetical protein